MYSLSGLRGEPWTKRYGPYRWVRGNSPRNSHRRSLFARSLELVAGPEDGPLGADIEAFRVEHRPLIMVPQQGHLAGLHHQVDALAGIRPIADDVAQAIDLGDPLDRKS